MVVKGYIFEGRGKRKVETRSKCIYWFLRVTYQRCTCGYKIRRLRDNPGGEGKDIKIEKHT